jgi:glutathione synthase/RimK-type ligase-like ATP-grasp enzyme
MILLWGSIRDPIIQAIKKQCDKMQANYFLLDQERSYMYSMQVEFSLEVNGVIIEDNTSQIVHLERITGIYLRPKTLSTVGETFSEEMMQKSLNLEEVMYAWLEVANVFVMNSVSAMASNGSKPYQTEIIRRLGFKVPLTLITTSCNEVLEFHERYHPIIYKSISGIRSIVSQFDDTHVEKLCYIQWCPTQFQQQIIGEDYRVHVIGKQVLASKIISDSTDYRYAHKYNEETNIVAITLPKHVEEKCLEVSKVLELPFVGIDLRRTEDNHWYCFEANPSPAFTYYENQTGLPITQAVVQLLIEQDLKRINKTVTKEI